MGWTAAVRCQVSERFIAYAGECGRRWWILVARVGWRRFLHAQFRDSPFSGLAGRGRGGGRVVGAGGKVFLRASTPYQRPFAGFAGEYERRVEETRAITDYRRLGQYPASIDLLDEPIPRRLFAGWEAEFAGYYRRHGLPASLYLDGRESVGVVVRRV